MRLLHVEITGRCLQELSCGDVSQLAFAPGGRYLLAKVEETNTYHSIQVIDRQSGAVATSIQRSNTDIDKLMACPNGIMPVRRQWNPAKSNRGLAGFSGRY